MKKKAKIVVPNPEHVRISATALVDFIKCEELYRLRNIEKLERVKTSHYFVFGGALHAGMEPHWQGGDPDFEGEWKKHQDRDDIDYKRLSWQSLYDTGRGMVDALVRTMKGKFEPVPREEIEIYDPIDLKGRNITVSRKIDLIPFLKGLTIYYGSKPVKVVGRTILDLKTSARKYSETAAKISRQLKVYNLPSPRISPRPKSVAFLVATKTKVAEVQLVAADFTKADLRETVGEIQEVADRIRRGVFLKNDGPHCNWCDFYEKCYQVPGEKALYRKKPPRPHEVIIEPELEGAE